MAFNLHYNGFMDNFAPLLLLSRVIVPLVCAATITPSVAYAKFYKCNKADGDVTYQETPCSKDEKQSTLEIAVSPVVQQSNKVSASTRELHDSSLGSSQTDSKTASTNSQQSAADSKKKSCQSLLDAISAEEKRIVAACKARRETYCNLSAEAIAIRHESPALNHGTKQQIRNYNRSGGVPRIVQMKNKARNEWCM